MAQPTTLSPDLADEVAYRLTIGGKQVTLETLAEELKAIGYRLDRSMDCKHVARYMTGDRAGKTYPACGLRPVQIDDGIAWCHVDARRDANFNALKAIRDTLFAVSGGCLMEI